MRILLTGAGGMLGTDFRKAAACVDIELVACPHSELDVTDSGAVAQKLRRPAPAVVINCAPELPPWHEGVMEFFAAGVRDR